MLAKVLSFCVWTLVAFGCMGWGVRLGVTSRGVPPQTVPVGTAVEVAGDWSRLLGVPPPVVSVVAAAPEQSSRYKLAGVMAPRAVANAAANGNTSSASGTARQTQGVALISVDGKPPRAFLVGARVDGDVRLQSVGLRMASLGPIGAGGQVVLELPPLTAASTSTLPAPAMSVPATAMPGFGAGAPVPAYPSQGMPLPPQFQPGNNPRSSESQ